jgi:hypothetical protein
MGEQRDPRKDPRPGDLLRDEMGVHMVCRRTDDGVAFARPCWDEIAVITLSMWRKHTPKSTEVLYVAE